MIRLALIATLMMKILLKCRLRWYLKRRKRKVSTARHIYLITISRHVKNMKILRGKVNCLMIFSWLYTTEDSQKPPKFSFKKFSHSLLQLRFFKFCRLISQVTDCMKRFGQTLRLYWTTIQSFSRKKISGGIKMKKCGVRLW